MKMKLTGIHFLLTFQCNFECDHCFVWGSPWQSGTFTLGKIQKALIQAKEVGTVEWIYYEGGEPNLYYPILLKAVQEASQLGFQVGIVSNAYWATSQQDARVWLEPFVGLVQDLSVSTDLFHYKEQFSQQARHATTAADELGIPMGVISVAHPETCSSENSQVKPASGQLPLGESGVMYRGRAAEKLIQYAKYQPWREFNRCPHEDLREPGRVHLDPFGNLHICQGISIGNLYEIPLKKICKKYNPDAHPIVAPLLSGGPAELARQYGFKPDQGYADACHLCFTTRKALRTQFPQTLTPDQMYGVIDI
jgi:MoaA/NifB/PqqE/SkfB family radical SAM enzyme